MAVLLPILVRAGGAVVIKETVKTSGIHDDSRAIQDAYGEGVAIARDTVIEVRVIESPVWLVWAVLCVRIGLVVSAVCQSNERV